ncbi:MAG TPA: 4Fe-4S binding protein, partial [Syntrophomonadaceae bacterium]|nr:4Fe-4S binding protein [Syntrophomonadaceae bacterium]
MRISTRSLIFLAVILLILSTVGTALAWEDCPKGKINCTNPCRDYIDTNGNSICDHSESSEQSGANQNCSQNGAALPGSANTQNGSGVSSEDTEQENIDRGDTVAVPATETAANQGISGSEAEAKTSPENESAASALMQPVFVITFLLLVLALLAVKRSLPLYARLGILLIGLLYLGFYLKGCMCPVGVLANLPVRLEDFFQGKNKLWLFLLLLPVVFILPAGRIYCGGVCPFGALQEFTFRAGKRLGLNKGRPGLKKVTWPKYVKYIVLLAVLIITPLIGTVWWCRIDPFVYLFNFSGTAAS